MDLEVARADRRLDPVAVAAGVRERLRDGRLARAVEPQHAALGRRRAARAPAGTARDVDRPRPEPLQLARRAGQDDDDAARPCRARARARCRRGRARARPRAASPACGRPSRSPRTGAAAARRTVREICSISRSSVAVDARARARRPARRARPCGRRASARGRRRRGRRRPRSPRASAASSSLGIVADDRDPRGLEPERAAPRGRRTARSGRCARRARARCP